MSGFVDTNRFTLTQVVTLLLLNHNYN